MNRLSLPHRLKLPIAKGKVLDRIGEIHNIRRPVWFIIPILKISVKVSDKRYKKIMTDAIRAKHEVMWGDIIGKA